MTYKTEIDSSETIWKDFAGEIWPVTW